MPRKKNSRAVRPRSRTARRPGENQLSTEGLSPVALVKRFTADFRYPRAPTPRRQMQHFKTESWRLPFPRLRGPEINHGCWKSVTSLEAKPEARPHSRAVVGQFHDFTRYRNRER